MNDSNVVKVLLASDLASRSSEHDLTDVQLDEACVHSEESSETLNFEAQPQPQNDRAAVAELSRRTSHRRWQ